MRAGRIESQAALRDALLRQGVSVAQPTVSRDVRELGLVKAHTTDGGSHYIVPADNASDQLPPLEALAPTLIRGVDGVGNLVVLHTVSGAAQTVAAALDDERRPEVMGTLAGDDTVLVVVRTHGAMRELAGTIRELATT